MGNKDHQCRSMQVIPSFGHNEKQTLQFPTLETVNWLLAQPLLRNTILNYAPCA